MRVIFKKTVNGIARINEIKIVADGYARNFLLPRKIAELATPEKERQLAQQKKRQEKASLHGQNIKGQLVALLAGKEFIIKAKASEQGTLFYGVTTQVIADILHKVGYDLKTKDLELPKPIKRIGKYSVTASVNGQKAVFYIIVAPN